MKQRRPGLQGKWAYVVNSLQRVIPTYELASSRISLFEDRRMRAEAIGFAVRPGSLVMDLGAGPGTMSRLVAAKGGVPVLVDASRMMLSSSDFENRVQAVFEHLPLKDDSFDAAVCGFALMDSRDLVEAVKQVASVLKHGGRFAMADLGKPDSAPKKLGVGFYLRVVTNFIGILTTGRIDMNYGSIFDTYVLTLCNSQLASLLAAFFSGVDVHETQMGGSIVIKCLR
jgi:ubiquinone/menaquinone biosynthesis C-methylase UbiE